MKRGFSLIELMVVITIISILSVFAMANFGGITDKGRQAKALSQMDELKKAVMKFAISHDGEFPRTLNEMRGSDLVSVPENPWGKKYTMDNYFIICEMPSGDSSPAKYMKVSYRDPGWIYYEDGNQMKRVSPIGGDPRLTDPPTGDGPTVCKEMNYIAYASGGIKFFDLGDTAAPIKEATTSSTHSDPCWSPEGNRIVYSDSSDKNIYVMNIKNMDSDPINISSKASVDLSNPSFSSDGKKVIAQASGDELWVLDVNAAVPPRKLVTSVNGGGKYPSWSNHGNIIIFTDGAGNLTRIKSSDYMEARNTRASRNLEVVTIDDALVVGENACWSPDDSSIVYSNSDNNLCTFSFSTKKVIELKDGDGNEIPGTNPVWGYR
ncbi:prepilin-type N-terminal cleavage/methylation domain-containing protein [bacterium]|nr:prepilin-type N-terminal cleavage/methylation domain-containing protein [bacterium]